MVTWHGPKIHKTQKEKASQTSTDHHLYERQTAVFCQLFQTFSQIHQLVCHKRAVSSFYWQRCYCIHLLQMNLRRYWNSGTQGGSCIQISSSWTTCLLQEAPAMSQDVQIGRGGIEEWWTKTRWSCQKCLVSSSQSVGWLKKISRTWNG